MKDSKISWTDDTWNPVTGCDKVSPGCKFCYAETLTERFKGGKAYPNGFDITYKPQRLEDPLRATRPRLYFVNSLSDVFHKEMDIAYIDAMFDVMKRAYWHNFQVLTKRADLMVKYFSGRSVPENVWLGVSIESDKYMDRMHTLLKLRDKCRTLFISFEPMLSCITPVPEMQFIDWIIVGGESGAHLWNEECDRGLVTYATAEKKWYPKPEAEIWVRTLRDFCKQNEVAFFFKQWGGSTPNAGGHLLDGEEIQQMPPFVTLIS